MILEIGRICRKVKGKDAGAYCVILGEVDEDNRVLVDGEDVKRAKVNIRHLEPVPDLADLEEEASTQEATKALNEKGF